MSTPPDRIDLRRFGATLRRLRETRRLTRSALAPLLGLTTHVYITNVESGRKQPSLNLALRASDALGISMEALLRGDLGAVQTGGGLRRWSGAALRRCREARGATQAAFARDVGLSSTGHLSCLETGARGPSLATLIYLADRLGVAVDDLLESV